MPCHNKPEVTCGDLIPDTCIPVTGNLLPFCAPDGECYRQSDFNTAVATKFCSISASITTINSSINLSTLTGCTGITPVKTTVVAEFQNVYSSLCDLKDSLDNWTDLPLPQDFDLACIGDKCCGTPPTTLGTLLEAMIAKICCITANAVDAQGVVLNTPVTGACPNCP